MRNMVIISDWLGKGFKCVLFLGMLFVAIPLTAMQQLFSEAQSDESNPGTLTEHQSHLGKAQLLTETSPPSVQHSAITIPPFIEPNLGQFQEDVRFVVKRSTEMLLFFDKHVEFPIAKARDSEGANRAQLRMQFVDANKTVTPVAVTELPGRSHYFKGRTSGGKVTGVPHYAAVKYPSLYTDIDLVFRSDGGVIEYDFIVHPGGDPKRIALEFEGADGLTMDDSGGLVIDITHKEILHKAPHAYQIINGQQQIVASQFQIVADNQIKFKLGKFDNRYPLIIDPELVFAVGFGGNYASALVLGDDNNLYITGGTAAIRTPPFAPTIGPSGSSDVYVAKISSDGTSLDYWVEIGGSGSDIAYDLVWDTGGSVIVVGSTNSTDWPVANTIDVPPGLGGDAFIFKLSPDGSELLYSSVFGGTWSDAATGIVLDSVGRAYITGRTKSTNFPGVSAAVVQSVNGGSSDAFVTRFSADGREIEYSTYFGGSNNDEGVDITLDSDEYIYIVGKTYSADFPVLAAFDAIHNDSGTEGAPDAFFAKLSPSGNSILFSSFLGGDQEDGATAVALDSDNNVYVAGWSYSLTFPTLRPVQEKNRTVISKNKDAFLTKIASTGDSIVYSTMIQGSSDDFAADLAVNERGEAIVVGNTRSADFPVIEASQDTYGGGYTDGFVVKLVDTGDLFAYSTFLGGDGSDEIASVAIEGLDIAYVAGKEFSTAFPSSFLTTGLDCCSFVAQLGRLPSGERPFAYSETVVTGQGQSVLIQLRGTDEDGDPLSYRIATGPFNGDLSGTGLDVTYTPDPGYLGTDFFTFRISDGSQLSNEAAVSLIIEQFGPVPTGLGFLPGGSRSAAADIDNQGRVVGWSETSGGINFRHAFLWTKDGGMMDLGTLGGSFSEANAIDNGVVVGTSRTASGEVHAFRWDANSGMHDLGNPGGPGFFGSKAFGVNAPDESARISIVGVNQTASGSPTAFAWPGTDLGTLGGSTSQANDINDTLNIVGHSALATGETHAFLWTNEDGMIDLGSLGGDISSATAINGSGEIVGFSDLNFRERHAFKWTATDGMTDLGTLGVVSLAFDINETGIIVGFSQINDPSADPRGFIWNPEIGMQELATLGGDDSQAFAINDNGVVAGTSNAAGENSQAVIWEVFHRSGDADRDGLLNSWETEGYDADGDGVVDVDLPAMGADPLHKDIFLQIDYFRLDYDVTLSDGSIMEPHSDRLPNEVVQRIIQAFLDAPVQNPDGVSGIRLHIDNGPDSIMNPVTGETWGALSQQQALPHVDNPGDTHVYSDMMDVLYQDTDFASSPRTKIFRHAISAHTEGSGIGASLVGGDHFWFAIQRELMDLADIIGASGVVMHEFGHSLGLPHGPTQNFSPNHLSIMNYLNAFTGLIRDGTEGHLDYSRFDRTQIPDFETSNVDESLGLNAVSDVDSYGTRWMCTTQVCDGSVCTRLAEFSFSANGPLDFTCNGSIDGVVNLDEIGGFSFSVWYGGTHTTQNDWDMLSFNGGIRGFLTSPPSINETHLREEDLAPIPRPFRITVEGPRRTLQLPGAAISYEYKVRNDGDLPDTYLLSGNSSEGWANLGSIPVEVTLQPEQEIVVTIGVAVPSEGAPDGTTDLLALRVASTASPLRVSVHETETVVVTGRPVANAGPDQIVPSTGPQGAAVELDGSASTSPVTFYWQGPFLEDGGISFAASPTVTLPVGVHEIQLVVDNGIVSSLPDTVRIQVTQSASFPCVYKPGFWKNTPEDWPVSSLFVGHNLYDNIQLHDILDEPSKGNGATILAYQLIAAKFNEANGAVVPAEIQDAINEADELLSAILIPPVGDGSLKSKVTSRVSEQLDQYNSGLYFEGPPSCQL